MVILIMKTCTKLLHAFGRFRVLKVLRTQGIVKWPEFFETLVKMVWTHFRSVMYKSAIIALNTNIKYYVSVSKILSIKNYLKSWI